MRESQADTRVALLQALGLHVLLFALMFAGLQWTRSNVAEPSQGDPIEADLVDPSALSAAMRSALQRTPEQAQPPAAEPEPVPSEPLPQPMPEETTPPAPVPEPDTVEQERVQRDAESPQVAKVPVEQEEKRKQPAQVDLDAQKAAEAERQRQQKIAALKRQREQATRERTQAEMRALQLADARAQTTGSSQASPPPGNNGNNPDLQAKYAEAIQQAIVRQWIRPESVQIGQRCRISIRQLPGGEVVDVSISSSCPFDELGRQSVERAVLKASPLPYAGFEDVFNRNLTLNFVAEER